MTDVKYCTRLTMHKHVSKHKLDPAVKRMLYKVTTRKVKHR